MADFDNDAEHDKDETPEEELLEEIRERYKLCLEASQKQRDRDRENLRFQVARLQWTDAERRAREGDGTSNPRPCLAISLFDQPIQLVLNQMRDADLGVEFHPVSEDADTDTAEVRQGLYRFIERDSNADLARYWGFDHAVKVGWGAYRVLTEYDRDSSDPEDLKIVVKRIKRQEGVFFDPTAEEPDLRDMKYAFVCAWMPADEFKRKYPKAGNPEDKLDMEMASVKAPEWVRAGKDVLVSEYWRVTPPEVNDGVSRATVEQFIVCGWKVLKRSPWAGQYIPIVPIIGRELQPFDEETRYVGLIEPGIDGQKLHNYAITSAAEAVGSEPRNPWIAYAETIDGYEQEWREANSKANAVLRIKAARGPDGSLLPPPQRTQIDGSKLTLALEMSREAKDMVQTSTHMFDASMGRLPQKERSGRAIEALQRQGDAGTGHFLKGMGDAMRYEAAVISDLMPFIYSRPDRVVRIVRGDDRKTEGVMVAAPFVTDPKTGQPMAPPPGQERQAKRYNLTTGRYGYTVNVGKSFQSRLEEGHEFMQDIFSKAPQLLPVLGDLYFKFDKRPGSDEIAKRLARWREKQFPGLGEGEDGSQMTPEAQKAQLDGMKQQMQQMGQQLQGAMQFIQTKQGELEAKIKVAQIQAETDVRVAAANNETKLMIAGLQDQQKQLLELLNMEHEARMLAKEQAHDAASSAAQADHEGMKAGSAALESARQRMHDATMAEGQREHDAGQAQQAQEHDAAMSQLQQPDPAPPAMGGQ